MDMARASLDSLTSELARIGASLRTVLCIEDDPTSLLLVQRVAARTPGVRLLSAHTMANDVSQLASVRYSDAMYSSGPDLTEFTGSVTRGFDDVLKRIKTLESQNRELQQQLRNIVALQGMQGGQ